ncbi:MAG: RES family NAD+ phosphorylase [Acidobacteriota bacterium]
MRVWRICKARYAATAFDGEGARIYSGRWHRAGTPVVYTSTSRSLAALELLVHVDLNLVPADFVLISADVPDDSILGVSAESLPADWKRMPPEAASQDLGTAWARAAETLALRVPSVVMPGEENVLLNPRHPEFPRVEVGEPEPFAFDPRLRSDPPEASP